MIWIPKKELEKIRGRRDHFERPTLRLPVPAPQPEERTVPRIREDHDGTNVERGVYIIEM